MRTGRLGIRFAQQDEMVPRVPFSVKFREMHTPFYVLIASKISDESDLAFALDLYDAIEETRILREIQKQKGDTVGALVIEYRRNEHISKLSALMSSCPK